MNDVKGVETSNEQVEKSKSEKDYKSIKPETEMSHKEALDFIRALFGDEKQSNVRKDASKDNKSDFNNADNSNQAEQTIWEKFCEKIENFLNHMQEKLDAMDNLTDEERSVYQAKIDACKDALEKLKNGIELSNDEKGNLAEMLADLYYLDKGYKRINGPGVTSLDQKGHQGIDGVYENPNGKIIIADAKYDKSKLNYNKESKQMSIEWIRSRLADAVGKEKADEILLEKTENVKKEVFRVSSDGEFSTYEVDDNGNKKKEENKNA